MIRPGHSPHLIRSFLIHPDPLALGPDRSSGSLCCRRSFLVSRIHPITPAKPKVLVLILYPAIFDSLQVTLLDLDPYELCFLSMDVTTVIGLPHLPTRLLLGPADYNRREKRSCRNDDENFAHGEAEELGGNCVKG